MMHLEQTSCARAVGGGVPPSGPAAAPKRCRRAVVGAGLALAFFGPQLVLWGGHLAAPDRGLGPGDAPWHVADRPAPRPMALLVAIAACALLAPAAGASLGMLLYAAGAAQRPAARRAKGEGAPPSRAGDGHAPPPPPSPASGGGAPPPPSDDARAHAGPGAAAAEAPAGPPRPPAPPPTAYLLNQAEAFHYVDAIADRRERAHAEAALAHVISFLLVDEPYATEVTSNPMNLLTYVRAVHAFAARGRATAASGPPPADPLAALAPPSSPPAGRIGEDDRTSQFDCRASRADDRTSELDGRAPRADDRTFELDCRAPRADDHTFELEARPAPPGAGR
jgi:hypothetical protein